MADKEITMVLNVDLECERCNKKIRRVLDKIKDKMSINTILFYEKRNLVTISGPFDAAKVRRKLCCEAGRIIKGMDVIIPDDEEKTEVKNDGGMETEEDGRSKAAAPAENVNLRPLLAKMLEPPKARTQPAPCICRCGKQTTQQPAAQSVVAAPSVWPAPASSVSGYGYGYEAPSSCYGVPVYSIEEW